MTRKVLLRIRSMRRLVPANGTASSLVVFSSVQCPISARVLTTVRAGMAVLAEAAARPAVFRPRNALRETVRPADRLCADQPT